jgi:MEDS: MEthanogen/methylotroph, DcmR Sensory domain
MSSWPELLTTAEPGDHVAQLYGEDDQQLARNVCRYLAEGLRRRDGLVVVATPDHTRAISRQLAAQAEAEVIEAERDGLLAYYDARATLDRILLDGRPDAARFEEVVGGALRDARDRSASGQVRAFGEMVSLLWCEGRRDEAIRLEDYWNRVLAAYGCSLFCAYRIDLFREQLDVGALNGIVGAHTHLFAGPSTTLTSFRAKS